MSELEQHIRMYVRQTTPALWLSTVLNYVANMDIGEYASDEE